MHKLDAIRMKIYRLEQKAVDIGVKYDCDGDPYDPQAVIVRFNSKAHRILRRTIRIDKKYKLAWKYQVIVR